MTHPRVAAHRTRPRSAEPISSVSCCIRYAGFPKQAARQTAVAAAGVGVTKNGQNGQDGDDELEGGEDDEAAADEGAVDWADRGGGLGRAEEVVVGEGGEGSWHGRQDGCGRWVDWLAGLAGRRVGGSIAGSAVACVGGKGCGRKRGGGSRRRAVSGWSAVTGWAGGGGETSS